MAGPKSLASLYVEDGMSIPQIAAKIGIPKSRVRALLLRDGVELRSRAEGVRKRGAAIGDALRGRKRQFTPEWKEAIAEGARRRGEETAAGVSLKPNGYLEYTRGPHKGRLVHDVMMEERIGRRLRPDEVVAHLDDDRSNNDENNLALMTRAGCARYYRLREAREGRERKRNNGRFC